MPNSISKAATVLALGVAFVPANAKACPFHYNRKIIDQIVVPTLRAEYGDNYTWYDLNKPAISSKRKSVELIFSQSRIDVLDTPNFVIEIEPCRSKVLKAYETSPFPDGRTR
jgi:hypothetical protein